MLIILWSLWFLGQHSFSGADAAADVENFTISDWLLEFNIRN